MKYPLFKCPLCCNQVFVSKQALIEHLKGYKLACSMCCEEFLSITALIIHLNNHQCENLQINLADGSFTNVNEIEDPLCDVNLSESEKNYEESNILEDESNCTEDESQEGNDEYTIPSDNNGKSDHVYSLVSSSEEGTFSKDVDTPTSHYMIVAHDGAPAMVSGDKVITTQNQDGSIVFNLGEKDSANATKTDADPVITMSNIEENLENHDEVYNCDTCKMSFTSVLEHIKKYHNDQDVVVEVSENMVLNNTEFPDTSKIEETQDLTYIQNNKRIITDTGDIVDAKEQANLLHIKKEADETSHVTSVEHVKDKKGRPFKRKIVTTKSSDSDQTKQNNSFHQVVMKDMMSLSSEGNNKMRVYTCTMCNLYAANIEQFSSHPCTPEPVQSKVLSCSECNSVYTTAKGLTMHMKQHKLNKVKKTIVKKRKLSNKSIDNYGTKESSDNNDVKDATNLTETQVYSNAEEEPFICNVCSTEFVTNKSLKLHKRMHDPIKTRPIEPPVDGVKDDEFYCGYCNKMIPIGYQKVHEDYHQHEDINCDKCNKKFTSRVYLSMHMSVHSTDKVPMKEPDKSLQYTCSYCERRFARPHEKVKHERIHTGEKPHSCEICGKSFRVSYCLTLHMRTHTGARPYECHFCGKRFKAHSVYNHHLLTHSDVRAYKCPYCPKAFKTAVQLAGHKNSHTKPFACEICNRPFASLYAVRVHSETHARDNSLKFSCVLCGASYARTFALKDHMKQAHNEPDYTVPNTDVREGNNKLKVNPSMPIGSNGVPATIILSEGVS